MRLGLIAGLALCAASAARAQAVFPPALDRATLLAWLAEETDLKPEQVVAVSRNSITAIVEDRGMRKDARVVIVRSEALVPPQDESGALSAALEVWVDCEGGRARQGALTGYARRNLAGVGRVLAVQDADWREPAPRTQLENVWRAVCDPDFRPPLTPAPDAPVAQPRAAPKASAPKASVPKAAKRPAYALQTGSYATRAQAEAARAELQGLTKRRIQIAPAPVGGKQMYRVLVTGFTNAGQAEAACAGLKSAGKSCFLRAWPQP